MEKFPDFKKSIFNIVSGIEGNLNSDETRAIFLASFFTYVGVFFGLFFGILSLASRHYHHGIFVLLWALLALLSYSYFRSIKNYRFHIDVIVFLMGSLCIYLIWHGGPGNTGYLWYYVFPLLALYTQGLKRGLWSVSILMGLTILILFVPHIPLVFSHYSTELKERFLGSFAAVTILTVIFEFSRERVNNELKALTQKHSESARTDDLTGLSNRRGMREQLYKEVSRSARTRRPFTVVMCDIDHFKKVNDTYGHHCGDYVLVALSDLVKSILRAHDVISRWGGEEFLILLPETDLEAGQIFAERIREAVENFHFEYQGNFIKITMSFGAHTPKVINEVEELIKIADEFLYEAKKQGRNRIISD